VLLAAMLAACALSGQNREAVTTYLLEWDEAFASESPTPAEPCASLLVTAPLAAPGYGTAGMAYVLKDHRVDYFATHRWVDTPARMLWPLITRALRASGLLKAAVESPAPIDAQLRLDSEVLKLRQLFSASASRIELSLKVDLYDLTMNRLLTSRVFSVTEPSASRDPYGGVVASNRAVSRVFDQLVRFMASVLADDPLNCR
jgi:cholesterol transport system auxiliary component